MKSIFFVILSCVVCACPVKESQHQFFNIQKRDITGVWYVIRNDSVYEEAIITENNIWGLDANGGNFVFPYRIGGDTIIIVHPKKMFSLRYTRIDDMSFVLENQHVKSKYLPLDISIDTTNLKKGDKRVIEEFAEGFYARKQIWLARRRKGSDK